MFASELAESGRDVSSAVVDGRRVEVGMTGVFYGKDGREANGRLDRLIQRGRKVIAEVLCFDSMPRRLRLA